MINKMRLAAEVIGKIISGFIAEKLNLSEFILVIDTYFTLNFIIHSFFVFLLN